MDRLRRLWNDPDVRGLVAYGAVMGAASVVTLAMDWPMWVPLLVLLGLFTMGTQPRKP